MINKIDPKKFGRLKRKLYDMRLRVAEAIRVYEDMLDSKELEFLKDWRTQQAFDSWMTRCENTSSESATLKPGIGTRR